MLHQGLIDLAEKGRGDPFKKSEKEMKCESSGGIAERKVKNNIYIYLTRDLTIGSLEFIKRMVSFIVLSQMLTSLYSPFFTSGLLSQPITYPPSSIEGSLGLRRGSLPSDSPPHTSSREDSSYFYASLQPRRDENEYRSFLSLDLAESRSMRSASLKHFRFP